MAAPCWALALLRHHTAQAPLAHYVRAEQAGLWRGLRQGACPVLPRRRMALPFARTFCLYRWGAKRLGVVAAEARRGRIISFYSLLPPKWFPPVIPGPSLGSFPLPYLRWSWASKPETLDCLVSFKPWASPVRPFGSLGCPYYSANFLPSWYSDSPLFLHDPMTTCFWSEYVYIISSRILAPII